jgi:AAA+ superfamily predicted ATPase
MTDMDARVRALRAAVEIAPTDVQLLRSLGEAELAAGDPDAAVHTFRELLATAPHDPDTMLSLARAYQAAGKAAAALLVLEDRREHAPDDAEASMLEAHLLADTGRMGDAADAYVAATRTDPRLIDIEFAMRIGAQAAEGPADTAVGSTGAISDRVGSDQPDSGSAPRPEQPRVTFADVGGMEHVKEEIRRKIIAPLEHPELYRAYGQRAGGGILMYGPPGCGKTHLARATAGEARAAFIAVGISDVLDMWIGSSERNLRSIFEGARAHRPSILFFDEVDALAAKRTDFHGTTGRNVVNQFLDELDGVDGDNDQVLVLAATNAPWHLDPAFRRPGRFDQVIFVPPPDLDARRAILEILLRDRPTAGVDASALAARTEGWSGADLKGMVDHAVSERLAHAIRDGIPSPITGADLSAAMQRIAPSTVDWFATARAYVTYANESGLYDPVKPYLKRR